MIEPMACSRMPKCRTRPYSSPGNSLVACSAGTNDGSPFGVVLLDSARSAEPPHSSGSTGAIAVSTSPEALRVATPLGSASKVGSASRPAVGQRPGASSGRAAPARSGLALGPGVELLVATRRCGRAAARRRAPRVCSSTSSSTSKVCSGSKPRIFLVAATSSSPSAEPCALPVFCALGAGQAMIVRRLMKLGRSVTAFGAPGSRPTAPATSSAYSRAAVGPVDVLDVPAVGRVARRRRPR